MLRKLAYKTFIEDLKSQDFLLRETFPPEAECLASTKLQKLLLEGAIHARAVCQEVSDFVELIWAEAIAHPLLESVSNISLSDGRWLSFPFHSHLHNSCRRIPSMSFQRRCISFHIRASVSPWQQCTALNKTTEDTVKQVCFKQLKAQKIEFTMEMSVEMPLSIKHIYSWTHKLKIKLKISVVLEAFLSWLSLSKTMKVNGPNGKEKLLQLIATLLVLQFIRCKKELNGIVFKTLKKLGDSSSSSGVHWAFKLIKKAMEWIRVERQFPSICYLELGKDWDSATKKILGIKII
ncbi:LOW QUALITY PROTEIN: protein mono-ADP-ribosyltransferase PARP4 [Rhynochetos jubatus]